jgi:LuxR family maltose regulon positive regulatory protein
VVRLALRAEFDVADPADVALVCRAPLRQTSAGYGKTLLLADWARSSTGADVA